MKLLAHIETDKTEQPLVYEGDDPQAALEFLNSINEDLTIVTFDFSREQNGEARSLNRRVKGKAWGEAVMADAKAWLSEI